MSNTATWAPYFTNNSDISDPISPPPPVTATTTPSKGSFEPFNNLACSNDQYSTSNKSDSLIDSNPPKDSESVIISIVFSAMSAAIFASFKLLPKANKPIPLTNTTLGIGSNSDFESSYLILFLIK